MAMDKNEPTEMVDTEPQRRALEEMSQALLGKLEAMVAQQEKRAQDFADTTHSLSSLPGAVATQIPVPQVAMPEIPQPVMPKASDMQAKVAAPATAASHTYESKASKAPPLVRESPAAKPPPARPKPEPVRRPVARKAPEAEGNTGAGLLVTVGVVIFFLLRGCS